VCSCAAKKLLNHLTNTAEFDTTNKKLRIGQDTATRIDIGYNKLNADLLIHSALLADVCFGKAKYSSTEELKERNQT